MIQHAAPLFACILLLAGGCSGDVEKEVKPAALRQVNLEMLWAPVDDSRDWLLPASGGMIEPLRISPPGKDKGTGRYVYFELVYPKEVGFEPARAALNLRYGRYQMPAPPRERTATWKNRDERYSIRLTEEDEGIKVAYAYIGPR